MDTQTCFRLSDIRSKWNANNGRDAVRRAEWFFDFISPYAYLQFHQLRRLPDDIDVRFRPVLFAGLLNHWGQLGPAEILAKKRHTFLLTRWRAQKLGLPFRPPPRHPFNPLTLLRDQPEFSAFFSYP